MSQVAVNQMDSNERNDDSTSFGKSGPKPRWQGRKLDSQQAFDEKVLECWHKGMVLIEINGQPIKVKATQGNIARFAKVDRTTINKAFKRLEEKALLREKAPAPVTEITHDEFFDIDVIKQWIEKIYGMSKRNPPNQLNFVTLFKRICTGHYHQCQMASGKGTNNPDKCTLPVEDFKIHPEYFDKDTALQFAIAYKKRYQADRVPKHFRTSIRHFLIYGKGVSLGRGEGDAYGISGEKDNFGDYAHIKLNDEEIEKAREWFEARCQELKRKKTHPTVEGSHAFCESESALVFFDFGIETCARSESIIKTQVSRIERHETHISLQIYESKTEKWWSKVLLIKKYPHAQDTAQELFEWIEGHNDWKDLFVKEEGKTDVDRFEARMAAILKECYRALGKTDEYFFEKPIHSLRHTGAHLWLRRTNWDYGLVAEIGGWDDIQTLKKCYGAMPPEVVMAKIEELGGEKK